MSVSHPGATVQLSHPGLHVMPHMPSVQLATPFMMLQAMPHPPQWLTFVFVLVSHAGPPGTHSAIGAVHAVVTHWPPEHSWFAPHVLPHDAQFWIVPSCVSHPSATLPLQLPQPAVHDAIPHAPPVQLGVAWLVLQAMPHPPQWLVLVSMFVSHRGAMVQLPHP
jgi:hypothetical protein